MTPSKSRVILVTIFLAATLQGRGQEREDWPQLHGPRGDNLSGEAGLLRVWPKDGPKRIWTARGIGQGYASVSVANGRIYTSGNLRDQTVVTALDLEGKIRWQAAAGPAWNETWPGTRSTPTVDRGRVYHLGPSGEIVALDASDGKLLWSLSLEAEFETKRPTWGFAESLVVDAGRLICTPGGPQTSVVALEAQTGRLVWAARSTGDLAGYATPVVCDYHGLRLILTMTDRALIGANANNGTLLFRHPHATRFGANSVTPLFKDGQIFITSGYGSGSEMLSLNVEGDSASVQPIWKSDDLDCLHGGVLSIDGRIYGSAHESRSTRRTPWVCLDWKTGKLQFAAQGVGMGSLTYADGMLYTLGEKGEMAMVRAAEPGYREVSRFRIPEGEGPTWAHPVVCGKRLYVRRDDALYAFDLAWRPNIR